VAEVMITHNTEVIVYDGKKIYTEPLKPRNLSGRSGRGDTCFSAYITERLSSSVGKALLTVAALVSLKMGKPGPFIGSRTDVETFIKEFYR
jgi:sugar/nucleoside kinase (ribokinase family)